VYEALFGLVLRSLDESKTYNIRGISVSDCCEKQPQLPHPQL
jgi:hypothetical protein